MTDLKRLSIQIQRQPILESHDRPGLFGYSRKRLISRRYEWVGRESRADLFVGHDQNAGLAQVLVAARVIRVPVRIEQEPNRLGAERETAPWIFVVSGANGSSMRKVPSGPVETPIPPGSDQHREARPERDRLDLDLRKILLGHRRKGYAHAQGNKHPPHASRRVPSSSNQSHAATPLQSAGTDPPK